MCKNTMLRRSSSPPVKYSTYSMPSSSNDDETDDEEEEDVEQAKEVTSQSESESESMSSSASASDDEHDDGRYSSVVSHGLGRRLEDDSLTMAPVLTPGGA